MKAIYKREVSSYFNSMIGWIFVAVLTVFIGIYFFAYNLFQDVYKRQPFRLKVKNSGRLRGCPPCRMLIHNFLRWHYPHQVKGRSARFLSAGIGSPVLSALL